MIDFGQKNFFEKFWKKKFFSHIFGLHGHFTGKFPVSRQNFRENSQLGVMEARWDHSEVWKPQKWGGKPQEYGLTWPPDTTKPPFSSFFMVFSRFWPFGGHFWDPPLAPYKKFPLKQRYFSLRGVPGQLWAIQIVHRVGHLGHGCVGIYPTVKSGRGPIFSCYRLFS